MIKHWVHLDLVSTLAAFVSLLHGDHQALETSLVSHSVLFLDPFSNGHLLPFIEFLWSPPYPITNDIYHFSLTSSSVSNLYFLPPHFPCMEKVMKTVVMQSKKCSTLASGSINLLLASCCIIHSGWPTPSPGFSDSYAYFRSLHAEIKTHQLYCLSLYNARAFNLPPFNYRMDLSLFSLTILVSFLCLQKK